jgi:hypothetical protein
MRIKKMGKEELQKIYGEVYTSKEMQEKFKVIGFGGGYVAVERKEDGKKGSLDFQHMPRFYYNFK